MNGDGLRIRAAAEKGTEKRQRPGELTGGGGDGQGEEEPHNPFWILAPPGVGGLALEVRDPAPKETPPPGGCPWCRGAAEGRQRGEGCSSGQDKESTRGPEGPHPQEEARGGGGGTLSCI